MSDQPGTRSLPYTKEVAHCYEALDLPYGAPLDQVTRQWKNYLEKCSPELHISKPDMFFDARKLTGMLTEAHDKIKDAWRRFQGRGTKPLPYDQYAANGYAALDLPYGAPMDQVTRQWKSYLKKCHPDLHADDQEKYLDANELTRLLTEAHEKIKEAWRRSRV